MRRSLPYRFSSRVQNDCEGLCMRNDGRAGRALRVGNISTGLHLELLFDYKPRIAEKLAEKFDFSLLRSEFLPGRPLKSPKLKWSHFPSSLIQFLSNTFADDALVVVTLMILVLLRTLKCFLIINQNEFVIVSSVKWHCRWISRDKYKRCTWSFIIVDIFVRWDLSDTQLKCGTWNSAICSEIFNSFESSREDAKEEVFSVEKNLGSTMCEHADLIARERPLLNDDCWPCGNDWICVNRTERKKERNLHRPWDHYQKNRMKDCWCWLIYSHVSLSWCAVVSRREAMCSLLDESFIRWKMKINYITIFLICVPRYTHSTLLSSQ